MAGVALAAVPQEHSHEEDLRKTSQMLFLNNPLEIKDAVFGLLGNAAAAEGAPNVQNLDCLQQIIADQAFTNAKAAGDLDGMISAIRYRALEKNTLQVGLASPLCNETAVNPEIASIQQHQDAASPEAVVNRDVELAVARSLASIGADPLLALRSATFPPGQIGDPTARGQTCNDPDDPVGCIFTLNLLTPAVTEEEILAAVADITGDNGNGADAGDDGACEVDQGDDAGVDNGNDAGNDNVNDNIDNGADAGADVGDDAGDEACEVDNGDNGNDNNAGNDNAADDNTPTGTANVQSFTGALGAPAPPVISDPASNRPFSVNGATFQNAAAALSRSCDVQKNQCANAANSGQLAGGVAQCEEQLQQCRAANNLRRRREAPVRRQSLSFGSCGSPAIRFAVGLDGRNEASFQSGNQQDFNHGSAQNIRIIADFTCQRLESSCGAPEETVQACRQASQAAQAAQGQAAADAFNSALGVSA
ncbi:hypothetical protein VTJ49DRAFT_3201 [Mycothermus thermophilus]|uniref:Uncharacterized protein n=1 Tax=Humicola insolens TaxID=85995 RepID=A0ABR3VMP7_HUMIN